MLKSVLHVPNARSLRVSPLHVSPPRIPVASRCYQNDNENLRSRDAQLYDGHLDLHAGTLHCAWHEPGGTRHHGSLCVCVHRLCLWLGRFLARLQDLLHDRDVGDDLVKCILDFV
jgi:hypothetical protein